MLKIQSNIIRKHNICLPRCKRTLSTLPQLTISEEIKQAVNEKRPVVSLESTIISHGLPYPANIEMAKTVENLIRENGAIPATIGFINGVPKIGLTDGDLEILADNRDKSKPKHKVSRRDIPYVMTHGITGGTTIAATMILSDKAGIDVFATGGLGGVSRPFELMDVSADLDELSKTPVSVVCSGPKSILDIRRTMEYLETKGVPVSTFNDGNFPTGTTKLNVPGFYTRDSGVASPFTFSDFNHAAKMIYNGKYTMNLDNGYVFCIPAPIDVALPDALINSIIEETLIEAEQFGISGKDITPFMLGRINEKTNGVSVKCNVDFVKNNAISGSKIAKALSDLKLGKTSQGVNNHFTNTPILEHKEEFKVSEKSDELEQRVEIVNAAVVGSVALDSTCIISSKDPKLGDSNPGQVYQSIGGVGFNIALASNAANTTGQTLFVSAINESDAAGLTIAAKFKQLGLPREGVLDMKDDKTAQYTSMHNSQGDLLLACADMNIIERIPSDHIVESLSKYQPKYVLFDSNISVNLMESVISQSSKMGFKLIYEPTSIIKASKLGQLNLDCFPRHSIELITPTVSELNTIFESFNNNGKFDDLDNWFPVLDTLGLDSKIRNQLESASRKFPLIKKYIEGGIFQQAFRLLPYLPNILIKDGKNGLLMIQITEETTSLEAAINPFTFNFKAPLETYSSFTLLNKGRHDLGVLIQHFPSLEIKPEDIKSVTGAGDSLVGYLLAGLAKNENEDLLTDVLNLEREELIMNSQKAACLSLTSDDAVNYEGIKKLFM